MKVLHRGLIETERAYRFQCQRCKSVVEATGDEAVAEAPAQETDTGHYSPMTPAHFVFACPVCENHVFVPRQTT